MYATLTENCIVALTARRRWLGWLISTPVLRPVARVFYDWFADQLYNWNQRKGRW
jgi:predicted DCC family thiol-disulfide oxidoreductase YuxK